MLQVVITGGKKEVAVHSFLRKSLSARKRDIK